MQQSAPKGNLWGMCRELHSGEEQKFMTCYTVGSTSSAHAGKARLTLHFAVGEECTWVLQLNIELLRAQSNPFVTLRFALFGNVTYVVFPLNSAPSTAVLLCTTILQYSIIRVWDQWRVTLHDHAMMVYSEYRTAHS